MKRGRGQRKEMRVDTHGSLQMVEGDKGYELQAGANPSKVKENTNCKDTESYIYRCKKPVQRAIQTVRVRTDAKRKYKGQYRQQEAQQPSKKDKTDNKGTEPHIYRRKIQRKRTR